MRLARYVQASGMLKHADLFQNIMFGIISSLSLYMIAWRNVDQAKDRLAPDDGRGDVFDFIIVGAGSAGSLLANRLSINHTVLLLEAGGEPHPFQSIPAFATFMVNYPQNDWQYYTVPQPNGFFAQNHQECLLSAGLGLGGSSGINFLMHNRGNPQDYDNWAKILNDSDWSYESLLPYFKCSEQFIGKYPAENPLDAHGTHGEMTVQIPAFTGMGQRYLKAANEMGFNITDLNGRYTEGFDYVYYPLRFGQRVSSSDAFLEPIKYRNNLTIRKYALVTKILFKEGEENEVYGVSYKRHGKNKMAFASKEVILSAGTINSATLLMRSGIGPQDNLKAVKVEVRKDLPRVGKNLQDHTTVYLGPFFINRTTALDADRDLRFLDFYNMLVRGRGPFTTSGPNAQGFYASSIAKEAGEETWPDTHLTLVGASMCSLCDVQLARAFNFNEDVMKTYYEHAKGKESFMQLISNGRPHSRGDIQLRSSNPNMPPLINPNYLDNEHDIRVMVEGIKTAINLVENSTAFQKLGTHFTTEKFPGCQEEEFRSDSYFECFVRQFTVSYHHLVGTCSMAQSEKDGVVDTQLRVFGVKRLRVVDASVMPQIPVGNTNWPTIMLAEKGAEMIIRFWESKESTSNNDTSNTTEQQPEQQSENEIQERVSPDIIVDYDLVNQASSQDNTVTL